MGNSFIEQFVLWKPVKIVSVILYIIVVLLLPISKFWAAIMLLALICFWSRIPGLISPFLKELEVVDFTTCMIAMNLGGLFAGIFGSMMFLIPRIFGPREWYLFTLKNSAGIFVAGLLTPIVFQSLGNPLYTMYCFTIIRYIVLIGLTVFVEPEGLMIEIGYSSCNMFGAYISNTLLMKYFEGPLNNMFDNGVNFDLSVFLFISAVIGSFYGATRLAKWIENFKMKLRNRNKAFDPTPKYYKATKIN